MLKQLVLLFAIVAAAQAVGGWTAQTAVTDDIMDLARWTTSQLSEYTNGLDHTIMTVKNIKTQVVSGMNYKFTLDVVVSLPEVGPRGLWNNMGRPTSDCLAFTGWADCWSG
jgi:hypothetical protein